MVARQHQRRITVDEWRALERTSEVRHEYIDGSIYAMSGGSRTHARIAINITLILDGALGDGPCVVYNSDVATRVSESRYTYAAVVVSCSPYDQATTKETEVGEPRVVVEVLSESTERLDRGRKWDDYRACPTLQDYVLVGTQYQRVEVYRRTEDGWGLFRIYGPDDEIEVQSLGVRCPVAALYRRTDVPLRPEE